MRTTEATLGWQYEDFRTDSFISGYLSTAIRHYPLNPDAFSIADLAMSAIERMVEDCQRFKMENESILLIPGVSVTRVLWEAGAYLWTVRNDSTCRFPSHLWPAPKGPFLTKAAILMGSCRLFVGLDGLVYVITQEIGGCVGG